MHDFSDHLSLARRTPDGAILSMNDHKGRKDRSEGELSRTVCFAGLRGRTLEAFAEMVG